MPRKKIIQETEAEDEGEEYWDIKKILIGLTIILAVAAFIFYVIATILLLPQHQTGDVLSERTNGEEEPPPPPDIKLPQEEDVNAILNSFRDGISHSVSSQSAITQVISELQKVKIGNKSAKDYICEVICNEE